MISVHDRGDLAGLDDARLFALMPAERRAIITENWPDYRRLIAAAAVAGADHYGVLFTSRNRLPRGRDTIGLYVRVLDDFLARHPAEDAISNSYLWLPGQEQSVLLE